MSESANLKKNIDSFRLSAKKVSDKINIASDIWKDSSYAALKKQMGELAKVSKSVIENGEKTCANTDKFFVIANERI